MKIVSKEYDYYDGVGSYGGYDDTVVFVRTPTETPLIEMKRAVEMVRPFAYRDTYNNVNWNSYSSHGTHRGTGFMYRPFFEFTHVLIGFCGKIYKAHRIHHSKYQGVYFVYTKDQLKKLWEILPTQLSYDNVTPIGDRYLQEYNPEEWNWLPDSEPEFREDLEFFTENDIVAFYLNGVKDLGVPGEPGWTRGFYGRRKEITIITNPTLKDYNFQTVVDSWTAYQEVDMFVSGILSCNESRPEFTDKQKVTQKGFDPKYGFRTRPKETP